MVITQSAKTLFSTYKATKIMFSCQKNFAHKQSNMCHDPSPHPSPWGVGGHEVCIVTHHPKSCEESDYGDLQVLGL